MSDPTVPGDSPPEPPEPPKRLNSVWPWVAGAAVLAVLAIGGGVAAFVASGDSDRTGSATGSPTPVQIRAGGPCAVEGNQVTGDDGPLHCSSGTWVAGEAPAPEPAATQDLLQPVGGSFTVSGEGESEYTLTRTVTKTRDSLGERSARGVFLLAHVKVVVSSGSEYVCTCSFQFVTAAGKAYSDGEPRYPEFKGFEELPSDDVAGGQNVDGWVVFDVPKAAVTGGRVGFKPNAFGGEVAYWSVG